MLVTYAKQETIEPLKTLGGYLAWGIAGSMCMALGAIFVGFGTLRFFQTQFDTFDGGGIGSVVPYVAAFVVLAILIGLFVMSFVRAKKAIS